MQYYAHISDDKVRRQTVKEHLTGTARRSELFAEAFRWGCMPGPTRWLLIAPLTVSAATIRDFWTEEGTATRQGRPRFREGLRSN